MQEEWREIVHFRGYWVSNFGLVQNENYKVFRNMIQHVNQRGIVNVSLNRDGIQHKRSVSVLVASAFVTHARQLSFDTPINLDGDRLNNRSDNLMWRPRNYATKYFSQFHKEWRGIDGPIWDIKTKEIFKSSWEAALTFGLLDIEVTKSIIYKTYSWPTFQRFGRC